MLRLRGVMAVAPLGEDPAAAFARLAGSANGSSTTHPDATWLSAGMSGDLEAAVEAGATHVRLGTAVLGARPSSQVMSTAPKRTSAGTGRRSYRRKKP